MDSIIFYPQPRDALRTPSFSTHFSAYSEAKVASPRVSLANVTPRSGQCSSTPTDIPRRGPSQVSPDARQPAAASLKHATGRSPLASTDKPTNAGRGGIYSEDINSHHSEHRNDPQRSEDTVPEMPKFLAKSYSRSALPGPTLATQIEENSDPEGKICASTNPEHGHNQDQPIVVDDDDQRGPINVALTSRSLTHHEWRGVTGDELSTVQQKEEGAQSKTANPERTSREQHVAAAPKVDLEDFAGVKDKETSKKDCAVADSPGSKDMGDYVCRLPKQQRDQYASLKRTDSSQGVESVARRDPGSPKEMNRQGTKRKAPSSSAAGGRLTKQDHFSTMLKDLVKESDTVVPSSKRRRQRMMRTQPQNSAFNGKADALACVIGTGRRRNRLPPLDAEDNQYAVDRVLASYVREGRKKYVVRWLGYGEEDDEEVDEDDIEESLKQGVEPVQAA